MSIIDEAKKYLNGLPKYGSKEEALREAVDRKKKNGENIDMVLQQGRKFLVCSYEYWEDAINFCGCEPVYGCGYIHDMASGRQPSEEDNRKSIAAMKGEEDPGDVKKAMSYNQIRGNA